MKRVLVISQYYRPEPNFITADVAEMLGRHARVTVVTTHPSYPLGRFYDSVESLRPSRTVSGNLTVWRLPIIPDQSVSIARRAASYLSFTILASILAPLACWRPDVVWVYNTPFTSALTALWFRLRGIRVVFTAADLWPESFTAAGVMRRGFLTRALYAYRRLTNRIAHLIVCATPGTARSYAAEGYPADRLPHVPVWVETPRGSGHRAQHATGAPRIVYAGNLGPAQQLDTVIHAAAVLRARGRDVRFELFGAGSAEQELKSLASGLSLENVSFPGRVPPGRAFEELAGATGQIVSLRRSAEFAHTVPSKLYGSFAAGSPILFGLEGDARDLALRSGGAIEFDPGSAQSLADAVERLLDTPAEERDGMRARLLATYRGQYDPEVLLARYRTLLLLEGESGE